MKTKQLVSAKFFGMAEELGTILSRMARIVPMAMARRCLPCGTYSRDWLDHVPNEALGPYLGELCEHEDRPYSRWRPCPPPKMAVGEG